MLTATERPPYDWRWILFTLAAAFIVYVSFFLNH